MFLFEAWVNEYHLIPVVAKSERAARYRIGKYMRETFDETTVIIESIFCRGVVRGNVPAGFDVAFSVNNPMSLLLEN